MQYFILTMMLQKSQNWMWPSLSGSDFLRISYRTSSSMPSWSYLFRERRSLRSMQPLPALSIFLKTRLIINLFYFQTGLSESIFMNQLKWIPPYQAASYYATMLYTVSFVPLNPYRLSTLLTSPGFSSPDLVESRLSNTALIWTTSLSLMSLVTQRLGLNFQTYPGLTLPCSSEAVKVLRILCISIL